MSDVIKSFICNKEFFERDYITGEDTRLAFDYVEHMQDEEQALQEIGIGIRDQQMLL